MKFIVKRLFALVLMAGFLLPVFSARRVLDFPGEDFSADLIYNETACPGDALYVRLIFHGTSPESGKMFAGLSSELELFRGGKSVRKASFFNLPSEETSYSRTLLAGVPLSTWWTEADKFKTEVKLSIPGYGNRVVEIPFNLTHKDFVSETIPLDDSNTAIKTDGSKARMNQIAKLNEILATINPKSVYQDTPFAPPTPVVRRTSYFGDRRVFAYSSGGSSTSLHYGVDYGMPEGTEVKSCAAGKVVLSEWRNSTGWSIVIEHLPGLYSLYYHLSKMIVSEGDMVSEGQLIALSGCTGLATGPHLHWEMRLNGEAVSPNFFTGDFAFSDKKSW